MRKFVDNEEKSKELQEAEAKKALAESEKSIAETEEKLYDLEQKKLLKPKEVEFDFKKKEAELTKLSEEIRKAKYEASLAELSYNHHKREEEKVLATDRYNKVYRFVFPVQEDSVQDCMNILSRWSRTDPGCDIEIVFCSPGGSIIDGFALFDFIQDLKKKGHKVTTKTIGYAASMAGVLLQAGTERVMGRESWMLIHEASFLAYGKMGAVEDTVDWVKRMCERIAGIFAERAANKTKKNAKVIKAFIKKNWKRKDWWLDAEEALSLGFCDRID